MDLRDRLLNHPRIGPGGGSHRILDGGNAKQNDRGNPQRGNLAGLGSEQINGELRLARHGMDRLADLMPRPDEQREDQIGHRQVGLTDQSAERRSPAQATQTQGGEWCEVGFGHATRWDSRPQEQSGISHPGGRHLPPEEWRR